MQPEVRVFCKLENADIDVDPNLHIELVLSKESQGIDGICQMIRDLKGKNVIISIKEMRNQSGK